MQDLRVRLAEKEKSDAWFFQAYDPNIASIIFEGEVDFPTTGVAEIWLDTFAKKITTDGVVDGKHIMYADVQHADYDFNQLLDF